MPTAGVKVLVLGKNFDLPKDYTVKHSDRLNGALGLIAEFNPDVIITSGAIPGPLQMAALEIRKRWINVPADAGVPAIVHAIESCYNHNIWARIQAQEQNPLVSVYTGTWNSGDYLEEAYISIKEQTYANWEWVVVDDGSTDGTWERLVEYAKQDIRVRPYKSARNVGKIGNIKDLATRLCRGDFLVEFDHDDMFTDFAFAEIVKAFQENPDVGMVYSNSSNFFENGEFQRFNDEFWSRPERYRWTEYRGKKWLECRNPNIYDRFGPEHFHQFGWFLTVGPNHVRAYRAKTFWKLGGYNPNLPVADDWDVYARFFLRSKCYHVDKMLYLYRILNNWGNTTFTKNKSIQDHLALGRAHYNDEFIVFNKRRLDEDQKKAAAPMLANKPEGPKGCPAGEKGAAGDPGVFGGYTLEDVSYVVLEGSETPLTVRCLESLKKFSPGSEIILVENGVVPREEVTKLADIVVHIEDNARYAGGCNVGAMQATRKVLCFINNDAAFEDTESPKLLVSAIQDRCAIVGPYSNAAKPPQGDRPAPLPNDLEVDMIVGVCLYVPTFLFRKIGGFDTRLYTWEDDLLCYKARDLGFSCKVVAKSYVIHERHATIKAKGENVWQIMAENKITFQRMQPKIKVIAIAKDEEKSIQDFFLQFASVTRDWCLLDTGSTDKTLELAKKIGVKVESAPLENFAQARNEAINRFRGDADWIIMLDPDERLDFHTIKYLKETLFSSDQDIYLAPLEALHPNGTRRPFVPKPFVFRNKQNIEWVFKVHEKLIGSLGQAMVVNGMITHVLELHGSDRRQGMTGFYQNLQNQEPYFTDPAYRVKMRKDWPILDYDHVDDERIKKIYAGPLVSVVIPTYKRPELLEKAVNSALAQDYANLEIVIVGDACPALDLEKYRRIVRVRAYNLSKNHGAGGAAPRNHAIAMAAGPLIAYLDDDNEWLPYHVSSIYEAMRKKMSPFGFSSMQVNGQDVEFTEPKFQGIDTSCVVHIKDLVRRYGAWKSREEAGTYAHDWEFVSRWVKGGEPWVCTRKPSLIYNAATSGQEKFLASKFTSPPPPPEPPKDVLLSIVIPTIPARQKLLERLLDQLRPQTKDKPIEVRVLLDNQEMTISEKRQAGIKTANGKYVVFIDDDDRIEPDYVDEIMKALKANPDADCVVFDIMVTGYPGGPKITKVGVEFGGDREAPEAYYRNPTYLMVWRKDLAAKVPFENVWNEDSNWAARIAPLLDPKKQVRIDKVLYHYQYDPKVTTQGSVRDILKKRAEAK